MKKQKGFTFIEILVVLAVFIITAAGGMVVWEKKTIPTPTPTSTLSLTPAPSLTSPKGTPISCQTSADCPPSLGVCVPGNCPTWRCIDSRCVYFEDAHALQSTTPSPITSPNLKDITISNEKSLLTEQCKKGITIFKSSDNVDNYLLFNKDGVVIIDKIGNVIGQPEKVPGYEVMELCGKYHCESAGGVYRTFTNGCADLCKYVRWNKDWGPDCTEALVDSCDCGSDKCWNGSSCEPN